MNKHRLPRSVIDDTREAYRRSYDYLHTTKPKAGEDVIKAAFKKQLFAVAGFSKRKSQSTTGMYD